MLDEEQFQADLRRIERFTDIGEIIFVVVATCLPIALILFLLTHLEH